MKTTHYLIYRITHKKTHREYTGKHITQDLNDGYMGSGKYIKRAIKKHGVDAFTKKILHNFASKAEMIAKEAEIVNEEYLKGNVYNIKLGGSGGWDYVNNQHDLLIERNRKISKSRDYTDKKFRNLCSSAALSKSKESIESGALKIRKISNERLLMALKSNPSIRSALRSVGLPETGGSHKRAKKLLSLSD